MTAALRLVPSPVFLLTLPRSGSTLLRCILDTHSRLCAPHELHLTALGLRRVDIATGRSLDAAGLTPEEVEHLTWDRILHWHLVRSGKRRIVEKTPNNLDNWHRLARCWPDAQYLFLLRHPANVLASTIATLPAPDGAAAVLREQQEQLLLRRCAAMDAARAALPGLEVRYEHLTTDPASVLRSACAYLDVPYEPGMLDYGRVGHGPYVQGIGDFTELIRTGRVQPREHAPTLDVSAAVRAVAERWGYHA
jgi:Sulfotransferase family